MKLAQFNRFLKERVHPDDHAYAREFYGEMMNQIANRFNTESEHNPRYYIELDPITPSQAGPLYLVSHFGTLTPVTCVPDTPEADFTIAFDQKGFWTCNRITRAYLAAQNFKRRQESTPVPF